jgi:ribose-phosphate pyrophosphokinase
VTGIRTRGEKQLVLLSGRAHPALAEAVAAELDTSLLPIDARTFADGQIYTRMEESVRGADVFIIQSHSAPINEWLMEQLIMVDAAKRASAKRITVVAPYYPYARQDKKHRGREPISARLVADLFKTAGADRLMSVDLHTAQIQGFFDGPVDHLFALPLLSRHVLHNYGDKDLVVVSPDTGRVRTAEQWADALGGLDIAFVHKTRNIDQANEIVANRVVGDVAGRRCLLIDDMIDTGGSISKAADLLFETGATDVIAAATHGVFSAPAVDRLKNSRISEVIVTNTLPIRPEQQFDKLTVLSISPLLGQAIKEVFEDGSVTSLFAGRS